MTWPFTSSVFVVFTELSLMTIFYVANTYFLMINCTISFFFNSYFVAYQILVCYHYTFLIFKVVSFSKIEVSSFSYAFLWFIYFEEFSAKSLNHRLDCHFCHFIRLINVNWFLFNLVASLFLVYLPLKDEIIHLLINFRFS